MIQHGHPVTLGDILDQLAHTHGQQRDHRQAQDEQQHEGALATFPLGVPRPAVRTAGPAEPASQLTVPLTGRPQQLPMAAAPPCSMVPAATTRATVRTSSPAMIPVSSIGVNIQCRRIKDQLRGSGTNCPGRPGGVRLG